MKRLLVVIGAVTALVVGFSMVPQRVLAYRGDPNVRGPNYTPERHAAMEKAFETTDHTAWKTLMQGKGRVTQIVTKENFGMFAQIHRFSEQGNIQQATALRQKLGLGMRNGMGQGRWSK